MEIRRSESNISSTKSNVKLLALYMRKFGGRFKDIDIAPTLEATAGQGRNNVPIIFLEIDDNERFKQSSDKINKRNNE